MKNIDFSQMVTPDLGRKNAVDQVRAMALVQVSQAIDRVVDGAAEGMLASEMTAWAAKEAAAIAYLKDPEADNPILAAETGVTREKMGDLAQKILRNAARHGVRMAVVSGLRRTARADLAKAQTELAVARAARRCAARLAEATAAWDTQPKG